MSTVAEPTVRCPRCGTLQPRTLDFCDGAFEGGVCHEYLGWSRLPDEPDPGTPPPAPAPEPEAQLGVAFPGFDPLPDGTLTADVMAGDAVSLQTNVRNVGTIVDKLGVEVHGLPHGWIEPAVAVLYLVPIGHEGHSERRTTFVLKPPRDSTATAGAYALTIAVRSLSRERTLASARATLIVKPFYAVTATARPQIARGRSKARFWVDVRNSGNTPIAPALLPSDEDKLTYAMPSTLTAVPAGHAAALPLTVRAPRILIGLPTDHHVQLVVAVNGLDPPVPPLGVIFRQKPLIPWWVPVALGLLAALAIALYAVWPRKVTMPSVKGSPTVFVAERMLTRAGLKGKPKVLTRVLSNVKSGTVLDQIPAPFARVSPDTPITLRVAVPATYTIIPDLTGMTVGEAEEDLTRRYLKLGTVIPKGAPPSRKIASQIPLPGRARSRDVTAVDVVLAPPGKVTVPPILCKTLSQAEKILTPLGLKLGTPAPPATSSEVATGQVPAAGTKRALGTTVTPLDLEQSPKSCATKKPSSSSSGSTSSGDSKTTGSTTTPTVPGAAGTPVATVDEPVAFDDGRSVRLPSSRDPLGPGRQPSWSSDGALLAVRAGSDLRIFAPAAPSSDPWTVSLDRDVLGAPAFAPAGLGEPVLAFLATPANGSSRLCLARVAAAELRPSCLRLARLRARSLAWSPGGRVLLVVGTRPGQADRPGVVRLRLTGSRPASAASWTVNRLLWRLRLGDRIAPVFDVGYDPRSDRLAVVASRTPARAGSTPQVALMDVADWPSLGRARWLSVPACQVAWSPTGSRVAVIEPRRPGPCPAEREEGRLVTFAIEAPGATNMLADGARNPAWRP